MAQQPTHLVKHKAGWVAHIYIAASLQAQLKSRNLSERNNARHSVCIRFREACRAKYRDFGLMHVEWEDLRVTPLETSIPPAQRTSPPQSRPAPEEEHCCDDDNCVPCDLGYHRLQCTKGCTIS